MAVSSRVIMRLERWSWQVAPKVAPKVAPDQGGQHAVDSLLTVARDAVIDSSVQPG